MKTVIGIILCLLLLCSCSHSTSALVAGKSRANKGFTIDRHEYQKRLTFRGLQLHISPNTTIDVDIRSIANFVKPSDIEQNYTFWPDDYSVQPWAKCHISF